MGCGLHIHHPRVTNDGRQAGGRLSLQTQNLPYAGAPRPCPDVCPPPIPPGIACTPSARPKAGGPAERATEAQPSASHPSYLRGLLSRSLALTAHAAVWLSGARLQVAARGKWRSGTAPCDRKLVQWCAQPSATHAHRQLALTARSPAHPLVPYPQPYFTPTYEPLGPDPAAMWKAGGVAGSITYLLSEPDTLSASVCG